ncbi:CopD family protein [uncultured Sphingomonas sp.]|uniref:CopD family protein n=1 Tax=uncultured Sphingomonas sp. TaxID=158754 RepID=UPI0035CA5B28
MTLAPLYPWLKALHVASALVFTGGVIGVSMFLAAAGAEPSNAPVARRIRRWDQAVTTPAMLLVWSLGLIMAINGEWLANGWLQAKLVLVVLLSVVHGMQSGKLRRLSSGAAVVSPPLHPLILGCVIGIAILAVMKPF